MSLHAPFLLTAVLQQGVVLDKRYGLALDGLLVSTIRSRQAAGQPGSLLDGGLDEEHPVEYSLPLDSCNAAGEELAHWLVTGGDPIGFDGEPITDLTPDVHRLSVRWDDKRGGMIGIKVIKDTGGPRGRFRPRVTPVLTTPAYGLRWRGVGDAEEIMEILEDVDSVGGRRGAGEGKILRWEIETVTDGDSDLYGHVHADYRLGRPVPTVCAIRCEATQWREGYGGIRPPLFHHSRQYILAVPDALAPVSVVSASGSR